MGDHLVRLAFDDQGDDFALDLWIIFGLESANDFEFSYVFLPLIWIALREGLQGAV